MPVHEEVSLSDKYVNKTKLVWFYKVKFKLLEIPSWYIFGVLNIIYIFYK